MSASKVIIFMLFAVPAALLVLLATGPHGTGTTSDTASYFAVAEHLLQGRGFTGYDGNPYSSWPPLFPMMLSVGGLLGMEASAAARWINVLAFAITVGALAVWLRDRMHSGFLRWAAPCFFLFAYPLLRVSIHAWTEPLFVLFSSLFLLILARGPAERGRAAFAALVLLATLAWLDRYVGITLVGTGALILLLEGGGGFARRLGRAVLFGALASLLPLIWILRNMALTGAPAGERSPSTFSFLTNLQSALKQMGWWIVPERLGAPGGILALLAVLAFLLVVGSRFRHGGEGTRRDLRVFALYSLLYLAFMLYTSSRYAFEVLHTRYLIGIHVPLFLAFFRVLDPLLAKRRGLLPRALAALLSVWLLYPAAQSLVVVRQSRAEGIYDYTLPAWRGSDLIACVKTDPPRDRLLSNQPEALYLLAGLESERSPRRTYHPTSRTPTGELAQLSGILSGEQAVQLVWFDDTPAHPKRWNFETLESIGEVCRLEEVRRCRDGAVYRLLPRVPRP